MPEFQPLRLPPNYEAAFQLYDFEPLAYQRAVYRALAGESDFVIDAAGARQAPRTIVLATGVRAGKSYGLAGIVPAFVLAAKTDCTIAIGGLEHRHAKAIFDQCAAYLDEIDVKLGGRPGTNESVLYKTRRIPDGVLVVKTPTGASVTLLRFSCDNPHSIRGQTLALALVDEIAFAQDGGEDILAQLRQRTMTTKGQIVLASSPNGLNYFGRLIVDAEHREREIADGRVVRDVFDPVIIRASTWDSPFVDLSQLKAERARLPRWQFDQDYGGQVVVADKALFRNFVECIVREVPEPERDTFYVAGLDPAGAGEDWSALVVLDGQTRQIVHAERWKLISSPELANRVSAITQQYGASLVIDATAGGAELARQIREAGAPSVEEVKFTYERKAELVMRLQGQIEKGAAGLTIPHPDTIDDDEFRVTIGALMRELELFQAIQKPNGSYRFEVPQGSGHDDLVTALYLAMKRAQLSNVSNSRVTSSAPRQRAGTADMDNDPRSRVFTGGRVVGSSILGRSYFG